ncbi:hypothetical protein CCAX7_35460 [Capsulimonas corticalis]|uniref:Uncharacterized protein n=1 Tax=Capsulimonas corticalis TaxID=2219043 RepID=A0A402D6C7_9BACT|nr:adenylate/guanylate cyclase domain-containing protein [Capsulimonas corticalis]BDI31495.1 hypothetical protein CCAX7_35460 [Capsulimonas corticalis]
MAIKETDDPKRWTESIGIVPVLSSLPNNLKDAITPDFLCEYRDGEIIFHEGEEARFLYIILHGQVRITRDGSHMATRQAFEVVGEQAIIDDCPRSATGTAQGAVQLFQIPRALASTFLQDPSFLRGLLQEVSRKLAEATAERAYRYKKEDLLFAEFRSHVSQPVLNRLMATGLRYGEPRYIDAIVLFSDIRSFTDLSGELDPADVASQLSRYLDTMVGIIHDHEGMVDKFVGDAVMAIWGYAPADGEPASLALNCAKSMVAAAQALSFGGKPISIGVGLNAGRVFIGNVGGDGKRQFTVLGAPVNLASRFETQCKKLGATITVGEEFYGRLTGSEQSDLERHQSVEIAGAPQQTLYTWTAAKTN